MKRLALLFAILLCCSTSASSRSSKPPHILGIARVRILTSNISEARSFYGDLLGDSHDCNWCETVPGNAFLVNPFQEVALVPSSSPLTSDLVEEITFETTDLPALRRYLETFKVSVSKANKPKDDYLSVEDPEGHRIGFLQRSPTEPMTERQLQAFARPFLHLIHAGFIVRDRAATEHFYKDIFGFRLYWHGGMKDDQTDWVSMQVPDGTDWLEFMVNVEPDADQRLRGIMNHIAIGVTDIHATQKKLIEVGVKLTEEPQIGRDGKWQLNLYDPDLTRVEFMEFTPVQKPCCSEFTGPHPGPHPPSKAPAKP